MTPYLPHTDSERQRMLQAIGVSSIDELFSSIDERLLAPPELFEEESLSEQEVLARLKALASQNQLYTCFLGAGSYDRVIPEAVKALSSLNAFVTAYTPYQPEISQGLLQAIFEFQSMVCELTGLDISNASLYDGHTAACEAASIMLNSKRKSNKVLVSDTVHPFMVEVLSSWVLGTEFEIEVIKTSGGTFRRNDLEGKITAEVAGLIVQSPNRFGVVEDYQGVAELLDSQGALLAINSDPVALALYRSPAEWGAAIGFGDTQPLGLPMAFGGPSCGYIAVRKELMRKMPGRIVGQSVDNRGQRAFVLTLQAREQHIKRERATSNICSNQALAALTTTIHLSLIGYTGLVEAAQQSVNKAHYLAQKLTALSGVSLAWEAPFWCEFTLRFASLEKLEHLLTELKADEILGGIRMSSLSQDESEATLLTVAVTEKRTQEELERYVECARRVLQ